MLRTFEQIQPNPDITFPDMVPPSLTAHGSLWTEIPYYTVFRLTATLDTPPETAVKEQGRSIGVWFNHMPCTTRNSKSCMQVLTTVSNHTDEQDTIRLCCCSTPLYVWLRQCQADIFLTESQVTIYSFIKTTANVHKKVFLPQNASKKLDEHTLGT
jgi:hypothetical protein